jgi:hypothetical protein
MQKKDKLTGRDVTPCNVEPCDWSVPKDNTWNLLKTLRDGFGHFNYRLHDLSPDVYFKDIGLPLAPALAVPDREPHKRDNYRVFICDWRAGKQGTKRFLTEGSDTRIAETNFAHLRYHLYCFLARFFMHHCGGDYVDILRPDERLAKVCPPR